MLGTGNEPQICHFRKSETHTSPKPGLAQETSSMLAVRLATIPLPDQAQSASFFHKKTITLLYSGYVLTRTRTCNCEILRVKTDI